MPPREDFAGHGLPSGRLVTNAHGKSVHTGSGDQFNAEREAAQMVATGGGVQYIASGHNSSLTIHNCELEYSVLYSNPIFNCVPNVELIRIIFFGSSSNN